MSAVTGTVPAIAPAARRLAVTRVALLGTGQVAHALAAAVDRGEAGAGLCLVQLANARGCRVPATRDWSEAVDELAAAPRELVRDHAPNLLPGVELVIDATASDAVAACHARWLEAGVAVVTANKRALGEGSARAEALRQAARRGSYGDSATVGAGLGAIRRLREFAARGERVDAIAGVLSGTLSWLLERFDGTRPFSSLVREAHALGYTEPDPREDVGGFDVLRKLRILARAAGWVVGDDDAVIDPQLRCRSGGGPWSAIEALDDGFARLLARRTRPDAVLAVVARAAAGRLAVGPEWLAPDDPLAQRRGCDNAIVIHSARYAERPLVLRGPGAGPALTAAALLDDVMLCTTPRPHPFDRAITMA